MSTAETAQLAVDLGFKSNASTVIAGVNRQLTGLDKSAGHIQAGFTRMGQGIGNTIRGLGTIVERGVLGIGAALVGASKLAAEFGDQMNIINTIAQKTPEGLSAIGEGIRGLARTTGADLTDLTGAYYDLLSAGIKVADSQNALALAYQLSRGSLSTTGEAVDFLTTAINSYGLSQAQTTVVADQFAQAVADGKVKMSDIAATFADVAPLAKTFGVGLEEIAAAYGALTARGVTAGSVTTQMSRAIQDLVKPTGQAAKNLAVLEKKSGIDFSKMMADQGLVPALEAMRKAAEKAGVPFQNLFGRKEGLMFALQTTGPEFAKFEAEQQRILKSTGALSAQVGERQQGLAFQFGRLKANIKDAGISMGQGFAPQLSDMVDKLSTFIGANKDNLVGLGKDIGKAFAGIDWGEMAKGVSSFADALKLVAAPAKMIFDAFMKLPAGFQAAIIGGFAANKLSGGLLGKGLGQIISGGAEGIGGLLSRGGSPANPLFVADVTGGGKGGLPGVPAAVGGAGILGTLGALAAAVGLAAIPIAAAYGLSKIVNPEGKSGPGMPGGRPLTEGDPGVNAFNRAFAVPVTGSADRATAGGGNIPPAHGSADRATAGGGAVSFFATIPKNIAVTLAAIGPGAGGVYQRAIEKGLHPSMASVAGTLAKNVAAAKAAAAATVKAAAAASKTTAAVFAGGEKTGLKLLAVQGAINATTAAINAKQFTVSGGARPVSGALYEGGPNAPVTVHVTTAPASARQNQQAAVVTSRWGGGQKT